MKHLFNKLSAFLVMLMCMSAMAQAQDEFMTMIVTKKNGDVMYFPAKNIKKVKWTNIDPFSTIGTAKAIINDNEVNVNWVQLWENGPKFAEYNVGATSATEYGGYYCWGSSVDQDRNIYFNKNNNELTGNDDTATKLWGSAWRMPTQAELQALIDNCDVQWTTVNGVNGRKFTGKGDFASNSVFLPAAGYCYYSGGDGGVRGQGIYGYYWSSTPCRQSISYFLDFVQSRQYVHDDWCDYGRSVRAVLAE